MPQLYDVIVRPVITEKALAENSQRRYVFVVHKDANKIQVKEAVEKLFTGAEGQPLKVIAVNTLRVKGEVKRFRTMKKMSVGRTPDYKKAVVTLAEGQSITLFEGV
ncbi:MAG: 50S ribosomal protein L23 [bacterium]|jgi:large subunit ribosomal protein L23